jgi:CubicO group peptidase (beta-lactamase class C family)
VREGYAAAGAYNPDALPYDSRHVDPEEQVPGVASTPLLHQPCTVFEYSFSTDILGRVVEATSGQRLGDFLDERLFGPLGMEDTGFHVPENAMTVSGRSARGVRQPSVQPRDPLSMSKGAAHRGACDCECGCVQGCR